MAGKGELYQQRNGKWAFRVKASNGQIVAQSQGYSKRAPEERGYDCYHPRQSLLLLIEPEK